MSDDAKYEPVALTEQVVHELRNVGLPLRIRAGEPEIGRQAALRIMALADQCAAHRKRVERLRAVIRDHTLPSVVARTGISGAILLAIRDGIVEPRYDVAEAALRAWDAE